MTKRFLYVVLFLVLIILNGCIENTNEGNHEIESLNSNHDVEELTSDNDSEHAMITIDERIEFISGVLSQTSWMDTRGPSGSGNLYFQDLQSFFETYKDHDAIAIAEELTQMGFTYDAPVSFILYHGELPELNQNYEYNDYLKGRVNDPEILEQFRIALQDLAKESKFHDFYEDHYDDYELMINDVSDEFEFDLYFSWMHEFYGYKKDSFRTILAPAMFPGGGYCSTIKKDNDEEIIYQIIREDGSNIKLPKFSISPMELSIHEFGHSYVNPLTKANIDLINMYDLKDLYLVVEDKMKLNSYGNVETFFNEQIIRSITYFAKRDFINQISADVERKSDIKRGFYLSDFTVSQLKVYLANRDEYETFDEFIPDLYRAYYENKDELIKSFNK